MARKKGSANFAGSLEVLAGAPIDARLVVDAKTDLTASGTFDYHYQGMPVWVKAEGKMYVLNGSDPTIASNWVEIGEGGGGGGGTAGSVYTGTLLASGWNGSNQQTLTFSGYSADYHGVIGLPADATAAQVEAYRDAVIRTVSQSGATVTFECEEVPSINLPVEIYCGGGSGGGADLPSGGTTGQVLAKKSNTDGDVEWKDVANPVFEIHFANNAVDVTYSELGEALSANRTLKLIDTENDVVLAFTGYYSGAYYFSTICLNRRQEMINTSIVLYHQAVGSDVVATQVQRLTTTEDVQKTEMPTADSTYLNKIYQYIGTTDANYTNGLFYECVSDGAVSPTYSWEQKDVQSYPEIDLTNVFASGFPVASVSGARQFEYSTGEQVVGTWIDGKPIYQITVDCGNLPKSNLKRVDYSSLISNVKNFLKVEGIFFSSGYAYPLPYVNRGSIQYQIQLYIEKPEIMIWTADNFVDGQVYVTLQYTKTTD